MAARKIMIVDDSKAMRLIVRRTLRQAGFDGCDITEAANGKEALELITQDIPDVVLSDWNMPEMNGFELLTALNERRIAVKFGFVTTEGTPEMRETASAAGSLFLIAKPFTPEQFRDALVPILG